MNQIKIQVSDDGLFGTPCNPYTDELPKNKWAFNKAHPQLPLTTPQIPKSVVMGEVSYFYEPQDEDYFEWRETSESYYNMLKRGNDDTQFHKTPLCVKYKVITPVCNTEPPKKPVKYDLESPTAQEYDEIMKGFNPKYIVCSGSKETIDKLAKNGYMIGLNRKTMRNQKFAAGAKYLSVPDTDSTVAGYVLLSDTDIVKEALKVGLLFMNGIRNECRIYYNV